MQGPSSFQTVSQLIVINTGPPSGIFIYNSPTPQFQTLIISITATSGTDSVGNPYGNFITLYNQPGNVPQIRIQPSGILFQPTLSGPGSIATAANELIINSPQTTPAFVASSMALFSAASIPLAIFTGLGQFQQGMRDENTGTAFIQGWPVISLTDKTVLNLGNTTAVTALTNAWPIPAGNMHLATTYKVSCWGILTMGAATTGIDSYMQIDSTNHGLSGFPAADFPINSTLGWRADFIVQVEATGGVGTGFVSIAISWRFGSQGIPSNNQGGWDTAYTGQTLDTTIAHTMNFAQAWEAVPGAGNTVSCVGSTFERLGQ